MVASRIGSRIPTGARTFVPVVGGEGIPSWGHGLSPIWSTRGSSLQHADGHGSLAGQRVHAGRMSAASPLPIGRRPHVDAGVGKVFMGLFVVPNTILAIMALAIWRGGRAEIGDGDAMQESWASYSKRPGARARALGAGLARIGAVALRAKWAKDEKKKSELWTAVGKRAVKELVKLGPTYVKLGQIVSCRPDFVPDEVIQELKRLQDEVPAFGGKRAKAILEEELGKPIDQLFSDFDDQPIAAASLGQVHRATTVDGQQVAIKVQRDKLKEMYDLDLAQFDQVTAILDRFKIGVQGASQKWTEIFTDAKVILYREIDYRSEAENTMNVCKNFKDDKWIKIPGVLEEYTSEHVLTMEYVPGIKIDKTEKLDSTPGIDRKVLAKNLAVAYLYQFCRHGFFNTDPHPGNLAVDTGSPGGRIILYDFGQACSLEDSQCDGVLQVIQSIVDFDAKMCVEAMGKLGVMKENADTVKLEALINNNFKTGKVKSKLSKRKASEPEPAADVKVPTESETMQYLQLPSQLAFVTRAVTQLNGVGTMLDEDFEFIEAVADKVPEVQMERGAGLDYLAGQFFKQMTVFGS